MKRSMLMALTLVLLTQSQCSEKKVNMCVTSLRTCAETLKQTAACCQEVKNQKTSLLALLKKKSDEAAEESERVFRELRKIEDSLSEEEWKTSEERKRLETELTSSIIKGVTLDQLLLELMFESKGMHSIINETRSIIEITDELALLKDSLSEKEWETSKERKRLEEAAASSIKKSLKALGEGLAEIKKNQGR